MKGLKTKALLLFAVALLLSSTPCLAACMACAAPSAPACHHHGPPQDHKQPCPHQLFRAMNPSIRVTPFSIHADAGFGVVDVTAELPQDPMLRVPLAIGLSPPSRKPALCSILRV